MGHIEKVMHFKNIFNKYYFKFNNSILALQLIIIIIIAILMFKAHISGTH